MNPNATSATTVPDRKAAGYEISLRNLVVRPAISATATALKERFRQGKLELLVGSATDPDQFYTVGRYSCSCPDFCYHYPRESGFHCKHQFAAGFALLEWERSDAASEKAQKELAPVWAKMREKENRENAHYAAVRQERERQREEELLTAIAVDVRSWPLAPLTFSAGGGRSVDEFAEWHCRVSGDSADRNDQGGWDFIPATDQ